MASTRSHKRIRIENIKRSMGNKLDHYQSEKDKTKPPNTILPVSKVAFKLITTEALFWITL